MAMSSRGLLFVLLIGIILFASNVDAFGAGNIASISAIEGKNWRHGDLEDLLKQLTCIKHHKWNTMMIKRVYFGNWLRDYSQAVDVGTLKKTNSETIRVLVWLLSFLGFGYATAEFEVTAARLGTYRPEEHIDNPKDYNDNEDATKYDKRLRGPVRQIELDIDPETGMKNYIANSKGDWATSLAYVKHSFERSIHHGRSYTSGSGFLSKGNDDDLAEALRCLGQGLHTLEDFGAHTNYVELALIEQGHRNVFPLVGTQTGIHLRGKQVFPLVTGTFGAVDFYHSVLGEATDHFTQSEVNEMDNAMGIAQQSAKSSNPLMTLIKLLSKVPGTRELCDEAEKLQQSSFAQTQWNSQRGFSDDGSSSRGIGDSFETTRSGPGDWNASTSGYDSSAYPGAGHQQGYQQGHQQGYQQQPQQGYQQGGYQQPGQYQYNQPPAQQQWGPTGSNTQQYHELPAQSYNTPPPQQYDQWQAPPQHQPQWNDPSNPQSYNMQNQPSGQYNQSQPDWQHQQHQQLSHSQSPAPGLPADVKPQQTPAAPDLTKPVTQGQASAPQQGLPGMPDFDPAKFVQQIYPILAFRDKVVRTIASIIEKIPGLEALVDKIVETLTVFILSLLAPFVRPVIKALTKSLQLGSEGVIDSSGKHQFEVFSDPRCSDPTHSMLSKDHFSNILNPPAGMVAGEILKWIAPRVLYAWEHPEVPVDRVMSDLESIFHHPAIRDERNECHRNMFNAVKRWVDSLNDRGSSLNTLLSIQGVKDGKNHKDGVNEHLGHGSSMAHGGHGTTYNQPAQQQGGFGGYLNQAQNFLGGGQSHGQGGQQNQGGMGSYLNQAQNFLGGGQSHGQGSHQNQGGMGSYLNQAQHMFGGSGHGGSGGGYGHSGSGGQGGGLNDMMKLADKLPIPGIHNVTSTFNKFNKYSSFLPGGKTREMEGGEGTREISGEVGNVDDLPATGYESLNLPQTYSIGGASELYDAAGRAGQDRSPSPMPLAPPSGYESYSTGGNYDGSGYSGHQEQTYQGGNYGGQSSSYYGGNERTGY